MNDHSGDSPIKISEQAAQSPWNRPEAAPLIRIRGLTKDFGGFRAVDGVDLDIYRNELFAILGGSGCGKTTLLRMLAGLETPSGGSIEVDGVDLTHMPPYERPLNMMFQSYAVFPHMNVTENVCYGLRKERLPETEIKKRVAEMLELVRLTPLAERKPHQLSGGERQRVALARALVKRPKVLLLDEPLAALDKKLREHTQFELTNLQYQLGITFIVVTHDQDEAMTLASRIAVMNQGRFVQIGTPIEIYEYPCNRFVADFFGAINLFSATVAAVDAAGMTLESPELGGRILAIAQDGAAAGGTAWIAVRPEKITLSREAPAGDGQTVMKGVVWDLGYYGNRSIYRVKTGSGKIIHVSAQNRTRSATRVLEWNDEVYLSWERRSSILLTE